MNNQYIGNRYVPKLFVNPSDGSATWVNTVQHESLVVVMWQGKSYTSRKVVPIGIDISNTDYWVNTADYNAQIAIYEQNVQDYHQFVLDNIEEINTSNTNFQTALTESNNTFKDGVNSDIIEIATIPNDATKSELERIILSKNPLITKDVNVNSSVNLTTPTKIKGYSKLTLTNGGSILNVNSDDITIDNVTLDDTSQSGTTMLIDIQSGSDNLNIKNNDVKNSKLHAIQSNSPNITNIKISSNKINSESYGILLNEGMTYSKNAILTDNIISANGADPIALNNPPSGAASSTNPEDVLHNVVVANNVLTCGDGSTSTYSGFGVSVAETHNVTIMGNIVPYSRTQGVHVEGTEDNCLIVGNVFDQCKSDGVNFLNKSRTYNSVSYKGQPIILANNQIKKKDNLKTGYGLYNIFDGSGLIDNNIITGNVIKGFDVGVWADGVSILALDKNVIKDCNTALKVYANSRIIGNTIAVNTPILIDSVVGNGAIIDKIYSDIVPTNIIKTGGSGNRYITSKGFYFKNMNNITLNSNVTNVIDLFENPRMMQGKLFIELYGNNAQDHLTFVCDVIYNGTTFTLANVLSVGKNAFANKTVSIINNSGKTALQIDTIGGLTDTTFHFICDFDGYYMK